MTLKIDEKVLIILTSKLSFILLQFLLVLLYTSTFKNVVFRKFRSATDIYFEIQVTVN